MRVKVKVHIPGTSYYRGDTVVLPDEKAREWMEAGWVEALERKAVKVVTTPKGRRRKAVKGGE